MEISTTDIKKRVRSANWEEGEKRLLNQLILQRIHVLENKDTSTNTNALKKAAWQDVLSCFNSLNNKNRNLKELMTQWRNTKGKVKSRDSQYKRAKLITGGGPPPPSPPAEDLAIINAMPNEFTVDINYFDSDSLHTINERQIQSPTVGKAEKGMDGDDPWTPLTPSIYHIKKSEKTDKDVPVPDLKKVLIATPTSESKKTRDMRRGLKPQNKKNTNYEQELFLLAKKSKERENERAEEIHRKRMAILELEYEYWKKKVNKIE